MSTPQRQETRRPLVSIGMPVFNGENFIAQAIASILLQSFEDFELIISDNASTDGTREICEKFAAQDSRIRYHPQPRNLGAAPNFDWCFEQARGEFFKWAAHDDVLREDFLEKSVALLKTDPKAVLCVYQVLHIGATGTTRELGDMDCTRFFSNNPAVRFAAIYRAQTCHFIFGLFRHSALENSQLHGDYIGSDIVLLSEMALRGPFVKCEEPIFIHRCHPQRFAASTFPNRKKASQWLKTDNPRSRASRRIVFVLRMIQAIRRSTQPGPDRRACYRFVVRYLKRKQTRKQIFEEVV